MAIWAAMASDKKRKGGKLRFILPVRPGQMLITDQVPQSIVLEVMRELAQ
jgi:3-dehydroquinate synthetase